MGRISPSWISHDGKGDPKILGDTKVKVLFLDLTIGEGVMHDWDQNWTYTDEEESPGIIVAYKVIDDNSEKN